MTISAFKVWCSTPSGNTSRFKHQDAVDFIVLKIGFVIEIDGGQHFSDKQMQKDRIRTTCLENLGLKVLRFNNHEVFTNIEGMVEHIGKTIDKMNR